MAFSRMTSAALAAAALLTTLTGAAPTGLMSTMKRDDTLKFNFNGEKVRGVNLGGWFVLEPWITPSLFSDLPDSVVDEYTMSQNLGKAGMESRMQQHWSTWITEDDFSQIAGAGLNFVRIPIGYWSVAPIAGDPYVQGAEKYLAQALDWANSNGISVLIDLHGAPGSQNGFDNSGRRGPIDWTQGDTVDQTLTAIKKLRNSYASHPAVAAIELLNEPLGPDLDLDTIKSFYMNGWGELESSHVAITIHDAFEDLSYWNSFGSGMWNIVLDTHHYEVFDSGSLAESPSDHVSSACSFGSQMATTNKWTIAGEWTGALTDCAQWLNGRGIGARYDGTYDDNGSGSYYIGSCDGKYSGTVDGLSSADKQNIGNFVEAQMVAFEKAEGWIFWTWKNEAAPEWHFQNLTAAGVIPKVGSANTAICG